MDSVEQFVEKALETVATDVAKVLQADEHYAPLVNAVAAKVLAILQSFSTS